MKHKFDVFGIFKKWKAQVENQTSRKIKYLRTNNGLEYRDKEFIRFCELEGITRHFIVEWGCKENEQNLSRKSQMYEIKCKVA